LHRRGDVVEQSPLLRGVEQARQVANLRVVVIAVAMVAAVGITMQQQRQIGETIVLFQAVKRAGLRTKTAAKYTSSGVQIHRFVFDAPPQSLDEDVVDPAALAVDADASAGVLEHPEPRSARGLCA
jgi:hypothetical protein